MGDALELSLSLSIPTTDRRDYALLLSLGYLSTRREHSKHVPERPRVVRAGLLALQIRVVEPRGADRVRFDDVLREAGEVWENGAAAVGPAREERVERVEDGVDAADAAR